MSNSNKVILFFRLMVDGLYPWYVEVKWGLLTCICRPEHGYRENTTPFGFKVFNTVLLRQPLLILLSEFGSIDEYQQTPRERDHGVPIRSLDVKIKMLRLLSTSIVFGGWFDDELLTCPSVNVYDPELHRKLWGWSLTFEARDAFTLFSRCTRDPLVV